MVTYHSDYAERVYAGWLGKMIGVRHGANIENWSYERIERAFGEITGYLYDFKNFAADDDINGPIFFMQALRDLPLGEKVSAKQMGDTWLNYIGDGHGFFWWGGYGKSTEHTAYDNLKAGIEAPRSGSMEQNSRTVAEQIGGQIFSDVWGLLAPCDEQEAADLAGKMASVSHDQNGIYGGRFVAACCAAAFHANSIHEVIVRGLSTIPQDSEYARVVADMIRFHNEQPEDWRACFRYVQAHYGYDRYPGVCHIIPNAAVVVLGLLYGEGDFSRSINIANMCGWDTDCNVGNVGAILGVLVGLTGIDEAWRKPINDFVCLSSLIGSRNIQDLANVAKETVAISKRYFIGKEIAHNQGLHAHYDFELPGSTHAFRNTGPDGAMLMTSCVNTDAAAYKGKRSLQVCFSSLYGGGSYRTFLQTYYTPEDFNDSRYDPSFTPCFFPGQTLSMHVYVPRGEEEHLAARLYVRNLTDGTILYGDKVELPLEEWICLRWTVPPIPNAVIGEVGIEWIPLAEIYISPKSLVAYIDEVTFSGQAEIHQSFQASAMEVWNPLHREVRQLTYLRGLWTLEDGRLTGSGATGDIEAYTGGHYFNDYSFESTLTPLTGSSHGLLFRVQGALRSYAALIEDNHLLLLKKKRQGWTELAKVPYVLQHHRELTLSVNARGNHFEVRVDGKQMLDYIDIDNPYLNGQVGFINRKGSRTAYANYSVQS